MSTPFGTKPSDPAATGLPRGELLGRYESYLDAQKVVDYLADNDFPVANVSIVGNDLKMVERVTAKLSYPKVALSGAAQGAMFGLFVGLILSLFGGGDVLQILSSVGLGMAIWMIMGVVGYSFRKGKRDFSSSNQVLATSYDVVVGFQHATAARALAAKLPMSHVDAHQVHPAWAPPTAGQGTTAGQQQLPPPGGAQSAPSSTGSTGSPESAPRNGYRDLPDGRPQFGLRIDPAQQPATEPREQPAADAEAQQDAVPRGESPRDDTQRSGPPRDDAPRDDAYEGEARNEHGDKSAG